MFFLLLLVRGSSFYKESWVTLILLQVWHNGCIEVVLYVSSDAHGHLESSDAHGHSESSDAHVNSKKINNTSTIELECSIYSSAELTLTILRLLNNYSFGANQIYPIGNKI